MSTSVSADNPPEGREPRPELSRDFYKGHGLGNDYLIFEEGDGWRADPRSVARVCDRHEGVGADGIVALLADRSDDVVRLRMFNPDGSEFERSGNGLRILGSYLHRLGTRGAVVISVGGDEVTLEVHGEDGGRYDVSVDMGEGEGGGGGHRARSSGVGRGVDGSLGRMGRRWTWCRYRSVIRTSSS